MFYMLCYFTAEHVLVLCLPTLLAVMILVSSNANVHTSKTNYLLTDGDTVKKENSFSPVCEGKSLYEYYNRQYCNFCV